MHPKDISIKDYSYFLPDEKIASYPLAERDASKLLIYKDGQISEDIYRNISDHLPENSLLLFNNTRVVEARLLFQKPTGGIIEIFCLEPNDQYADITSAMLQKEKVFWKCLVGGASKWKRGQVLEKKINSGNQQIVLTGRYIEKRPDHFIVELAWSPHELIFAELLHYAGAMPLPPYIKRSPEISDAERYQTIYACREGSVAAPTAGLHFTNIIFEKLKGKNILTDFATLHVGAGTFKPVKTEIMKEHEMHAEYIDVSKHTIENIFNNINNKIIAVGTTTLRTIESLYWTGVNLAMSNIHYKTDNSQQVAEITQWEVYDQLRQDISPVTALKTLLGWLEKNKMERLITKTRIIIAPGYKTKIVSGLITNFHQPGSTLLLLVAALTGEDWKKVYDHALANNFRFLSYGDGCLLWVKTTNSSLGAFR